VNKKHPNKLGVKKVFQRLLMFIVGLPLVLGLILFLPWKNHFTVNLVITLFSCLGAMELAGLLQKKGINISKAAAAFLGGVLPCALTLIVSFNLPPVVLPLAGVFFLCAALLRFVFHPDTGASAEKTNAAVHYFAAGSACFLYPGAFLSWIIAMNGRDNAAFLVIAFLLMAFGNDSASWAAGMLFGRSSRGIIKVSPNKSAAGYAGGILVSMLIGGLAAWLYPAVFKPALFHWLPSGLVLGFFVAVAGSLGDLAESALKRSADVKDSGRLILGRGGVLDSVDSLCFAAPVYFLLTQVLFR
jgi:phosphatidate cytidylyltransferase